MKIIQKLFKDIRLKWILRSKLVALTKAFKLKALYNRYIPCRSRIFRFKYLSRSRQHIVWIFILDISRLFGLCAGYNKCWRKFLCDLDIIKVHKSIFQTLFNYIRIRPHKVLSRWNAAHAKDLILLVKGNALYFYLRHIKKQKHTQHQQQRRSRKKSGNIHVAHIHCLPTCRRPLWVHSVFLVSSVHFTLS